MRTAALWLPLGEYARRAGVSRKTLNRYAGENKISFRLSDKRSPNGKPEREFLWNPGALALRVNEAPPVNLSEKQQAEHDGWLARLAPMRAAEDAGKSLTAIVKQISAETGFNPATIWNKWSLSKKGKPLARKARRRERLKWKTEQYPQLQGVIAAKFLEMGSVAAAWDAVKREWGSALLPYQGEPPGREFCREVANALGQSHVDAYRLPKNKWDSKRAPHMVTGRGQYTIPLECWVADHRLFDVLVMDDCFDGDLAAVRLWVTAIQDMRTRVIVGASYSLDPSWRTIATALRQGVSGLGIPELFYCDNGKDFRKIGAGAQRGSLLASQAAPTELDELGRVRANDGLLAGLGIKVCYCIPRHPKSKQIESFFNFLALRFDKMFFKAGYTGAKPEFRSEFCREQEKQHSAFLAQKRPDSPLEPASRFMRLNAQWLDEYNHEHQHGGRGMNGRTPMAVMNELLPAPQRAIPDMAALAPLFWKVERRKVENCKITIRRATYSALLDDPDGQTAMYQANGSEIVVRHDPNDPASALAYEDRPDGHLLARLVCDEIGAQERPTTERVKAMMVQTSRLYKRSREITGAIVASVPPERELLAERGGIERKATGTYGPMRPQLPATASAFTSDDAARDRSAWKD